MLPVHDGRDGDELLHHYVCLAKRGTQPRLEPVGRLMPNDFGLFDMYGNVSEWNAELPDSSNHVFTSGGGYKALPHEFDSQYGMMTSPELEYNQLGFRIARTIAVHDHDTGATE